MDELPSEASIFRQPHDDADTQSIEGSAVSTRRAWASRRWDRGRSTAPRSRDTRCCRSFSGTHGVSPGRMIASNGLTRRQVWAADITYSRWREASYTWWRSSIGILGGCSPEWFACPTRWRSVRGAVIEAVASLRSRVEIFRLGPDRALSSIAEEFAASGDQTVAGGKGRSLSTTSSGAALASRRIRTKCYLYATAFWISRG